MTPSEAATLLNDYMLAGAVLGAILTFGVGFGVATKGGK